MPLLLKMMMPHRYNTPCQVYAFEAYRNIAAGHHFAGQSAIMIFAIHARPPPIFLPEMPIESRTAGFHFHDAASSLKKGHDFCLEMILPRREQYLRRRCRT